MNIYGIFSYAESILMIHMQICKYIYTCIWNYTLYELYIYTYMKHRHRTYEDIKETIYGVEIYQWKECREVDHGLWIWAENNCISYICTYVYAYMKIS